MKTINIVKYALAANAASLGYNWIYDRKFLDKKASEGSLLFKEPNTEDYELASISYDAYPNAKLGHLSLQGQITTWLYKALQDNVELSAEDYYEIIKNKFKPGGTYQGYVESYGKKISFNTVIEELELKVDKLNLEDDQLVSFHSYLVAKVFKKDNEFAFEIASIFTNNKDYLNYYEVFDYIIDNPDEDLNNKLKKAILLAPKNHRETLVAALRTLDSNKFIQKHSGTACNYDDAIPLIFHIMNMTESFNEALELNMKFGGATADRALILGALLSSHYDIDDEFVEKANITI